MWSTWQHRIPPYLGGGARAVKHVAARPAPCLDLMPVGGVPVYKVPTTTGQVLINVDRIAQLVVVLNFYHLKSDMHFCPSSLY
jgi:hypothetical protein